VRCDKIGLQSSSFMGDVDGLFGCAGSGEGEQVPGIESAKPARAPEGSTHS
jgi:hypothetical protein